MFELCSMQEHQEYVTFQCYIFDIWKKWCLCGLPWQQQNPTRFHLNINYRWDWIIFTRKWVDLTVCNFVLTLRCTVVILKMKRLRFIWFCCAATVTQKCGSNKRADNCKTLLFWQSYVIELKPLRVSIGLLVISDCV